VVIAFSRLTYARNLDYRDYDRIWSDTIAKRPRNARARNNYATSLLAQRRFADAEPHLRVAVEQDPRSAEAEANLGVALSAQGRYDEGARHLERAVALRPDFAEAHRNLGENYALQHRMVEAVNEYTKALASLRNDVMLLNRAAWILSTAKDPRARDGAMARVFAERAAELTSRQDPDSLDSLAASLAELGEFERAVATAGEALHRARARGDLALSRNIEARAALYARREPFREP
jgi:tetratricopeptide (TPR) repeat protein